MSRHAAKRPQSAATGRQPAGAGHVAAPRPFAPVREPLPPAVQASLRVSRPGDAAEREADRVADTVLRMPAPGVQRMCTGCEEQLQRKEAPHAGPATAAPLAGLGAGQPLPAAERAFFEPRFGFDFGQVRIHAGEHAAATAAAYDARAFTLGRDVVFGAGQYAPGSADGRRLLAHELTHVVQQQAQPATTATGTTGCPAWSTGRPPPRIRQDGVAPVQRAAPAAAIGALAAKCIVGAIMAVLVDLGFQALLYAWKKRTWRFWELTVDYCSLVISAILGCIGGVVAAKWLEPWIDKALGPKLGGVAGGLIGKVLIFIAKKLGMAIPKGLTKTLLKLGCVSEEQAAELDPEVAALVAGERREEGAAEPPEKAVA